MHLLMNRGYPQQGLSLWKALQQLHQLGKFSTFSLTDEHLPRLQQLLEQYQSLPMDLADASLVLLAELRIGLVGNVIKQLIISEGTRLGE